MCMTAMLDNLHADGLNRSEPIAALWAADTAIYPRFGYGRASRLLRPRSSERTAV